MRMTLHAKAAGLGLPKAAPEPRLVLFIALAITVSWTAFLVYSAAYLWLVLTGVTE